MSSHNVLKQFEFLWKMSDVLLIAFNLLAITFNVVTAAFNVGNVALNATCSAHCATNAGRSVPTRSPFSCECTASTVKRSANFF